MWPKLFYWQVQGKDLVNFVGKFSRSTVQDYEQELMFSNSTYIQFSRLLSARVDVKKLVKRIISWTLLLVFILRRFWALCFMMLNSWWRVFMIHFHNEIFFFTVLCSFRTVLIGNYFILSSWDQIYVLNSPRGYTP